MEFVRSKTEFIKVLFVVSGENSAATAKTALCDSATKFNF